MTGTIFERTLATAAIEAAFADAQIVVAMLTFEAALAEAQAAEGLIPESAAAAIGAACRGVPFDIEAIVAEARRAGALAIPLVLQLKARVAAAAPEAACFVHHGSTSQDAIDTAMVLVTREALALIETDLDRLVGALGGLARRHLETPMLGRTLLQPAEVVSFGHEVAACWRRWCAAASAAPAARRPQRSGVRSARWRRSRQGPGVARRVGERLGLALPAGAWHTQRDAWVTLGCSVAVLCGALGKIGRDLALLAQGEVGEVFEPREAGRGTSSAMPHKRNPVAAMVAIAAATRAPAPGGDAARGDCRRRISAASRLAAGSRSGPRSHVGARRGAGRPNVGAGLEVDVARMRATSTPISDDRPRCRRCPIEAAARRAVPLPGAARRPRIPSRKPSP